MMVMENGLRHRGTGMKVVMVKLKEKPVQESLRSKAVNHLLPTLLSKITSTSELEGVKLLIATVLQNA
jgi:hypothetical protein